MKLLGISLGALLTAAMVWATLWFWGQTLTYKPYDHPLMSWTHEKPVIALSADNVDEAARFLKNNPDGVLYLNLRVSQEGQLFTVKSGGLDFITNLYKSNPRAYKGNKGFYYEFNFLKENSPTVTAIEDWAALNPRFWIFNIVDNALDIDKFLTEWITKNDFAMKVVITSEADIVISSMKSQNPLWIYGTSLSDLTKMLTMASINLEGLVDYKRDYFITPLELKNRDAINPKLIIEMKKRFKKVAIGPVHSDLDRDRALVYKPDILIFDSLNIVK